jgi:hypothetical protein
VSRYKHAQDVRDLEETVLVLLVLVRRTLEVEQGEVRASVGLLLVQQEPPQLEHSLKRKDSQLALVCVVEEDVVEHQEAAQKGQELNKK